MLLPTVVSAAFLKRFKSEYLDSSLRGMLGTQSGSGSASYPADLGLRELKVEGTGRSSQICGNEGCFADINHHWRVERLKVGRMCIRPVETPVPLQR